MPESRCGFFIFLLTTLVPVHKKLVEVGQSLTELRESDASAKDGMSRFSPVYIARQAEWLTTYRGASPGSTELALY
jgi:hypothetical protein